MNRFSVLTGFCYAMTTPIGVHAGYMMAMQNWVVVVAEIGVLMCLQVLAPTFWIKAQTMELEKEKAKRRAARAKRKAAAKAKAA